MILLFAENKFMVNLNIPLGDPLQPTRVKDPETRETVLMGKLRLILRMLNLISSKDKLFA